MGWLVDRTAEFHARGERGSDLASVLGDDSARAEIVTTGRPGWLGVGRVRISSCARMSSQTRTARAVSSVEARTQRIG
jgi:hypothetical protein